MKTTDTARQRLDPDFSIKGLEAGLTALDPNRATGYAQLGRARAAKSASLAREQKLLAIKHGTTGTPRAQYAAQALQRNERFRGELAASREVLESTTPVVDDTSFVVYGFVRRRNQTGIPGLTLALTDAEGTWLKEGGYACTDQRGYFELRMERDPTKTKAKTDEELKQEAAAAAEAVRKAAAEAAAAGETKSGDPQPSGGGVKITTNRQAAARLGYQLRVFNRDGRVLHVERRPVTPEVKTVDYRLIILDDDDCGCTPPPEKSDGKPAPKGPRPPVAPPAAPAQPAESSVAPRVAELKSYANLPTAGAAGQPLEAIRGIGTKRAAALRAAGIGDVAAFEKTEGAALVKLAGFDKNPPKAAPSKVAAEKAVAAQPAAERDVAAKSSEAQLAPGKITAKKAAPAKVAKKAPATKPATKAKKTSK